MFEITRDDKELEALVDADSISLMQAYKKNFIEHEGTLSVIMKAKRYLMSDAASSHRVFWNAAGFIIISSYDLKVIGRELTFARHEWSKRLFARQACHLMYELMNDILEITGKEFKKVIESSSDAVDFTQELKQIKYRLNEFKAEHGDTLKQIRNISSAHRDQDVYVQMETILAIGWLSTFEMVTKFDKILMDLAELIQKLMNSHPGIKQTK